MAVLTALFSKRARCMGMLCLGLLASCTDEPRPGDQDPGLSANFDRSGRRGAAAGPESTTPAAERVVTPEERSCGVTRLLCDGVCVSHLQDPQNCGACGRSCEGAICSEGRCAPYGLVAAMDHIGSIAVDDAHVYFAAEGKVFSSTKRGTFIAKLPSHDAIGKTIAQDGDHIYYYVPREGHFGRTRKDGTGVERLQTAPGFRGVFQLDAGGLVWVERVSDGRDRIVVGTSPTSSPKVLGAVGGLVRGMATDDAYVYVTLHTGSIVRVSRGGSCDAAACGDVLFERSYSPGPIAILGTNIFWAEEANGVVYQASKAGGDVDAYADGAGRPYDLRVDERGITFAVMRLDGQSDIVHRDFAWATGTQEVARVSGLVDGLGTDSKATYWTSRSDGSLYKALR
jgi:hypothetical protein